MVEEILQLGINRLELGYDLTMDLVPGVRRMVDTKAVTVESVHAICPVPLGAPCGHPELFVLTSSRPNVRRAALTHIEGTVRFAADIGARTVVLHAGNVEMRHRTRQLLELQTKGQEFSRRFERIKTKLLLTRDKRAQKHLDHLYEGIEQLLPILQQTNTRLALETLPTWESVPTELEAQELLKHFDSPNVRYWYDIGHGQMRENLGFAGQTRWLERLAPYLAGWHVHDMARPASDHIMPPAGEVDFAALTRFIMPGASLILEPRPGLPSEDIVAAVKFLQPLWANTR